MVFDHLTYSVFQPVRHSVYHWFDPGQYGVFVFFLVSGYIVPASLERKGSARGFWVSRVFRLYPLYLFAVGAMIVLWAGGIGSLSGILGATLGRATGEMISADHKTRTTEWDDRLPLSLCDAADVVFTAT